MRAPQFCLVVVQGAEGMKPAPFGKNSYLCETIKKKTKAMETTKHAGGMKILRLFKKMNKKLSKSLPTTDVCEWHLEMSFTNSETRYMMRVCFDYDHKIITYQEGDDISIFMAKVKEEIDFYKHYEDGN